MKVGMLLRRFTQGGIERVIMRLLPLFKNSGYEIVIFSEKDRSFDLFANVPEHKRVVVGSGVQRAENLARALKEEKIEICVLEEYWAPNFVEDCSVLWKIGLPYIVHFHNVFSEFFVVPEFWRDKRAYYAACARANAVVVLSKCDEYYFRLIGCNAHYFPNPLEDVPRGIERREEAFSILWVARFVRAKHPEDALHIFEKVLERFPQATLTMVGGTDSKEAGEILREIQSKPHLQKAVKLPGFTDNVWQYYSKASLFLATSFHEGFPCTFMEAAAMGIPIVGYNLPHLETVRTNRGFIPVEKGDVDGAAEAICNLFANYETLEKAGAANRAIFDQFDSFDQMTAYGNLFKEVKAGIRAMPPEGDELVQVCLKTLSEHAAIGIAALKDELMTCRKWMKRAKRARRKKEVLIVILLVLLLLMLAYIFVI